MEKPTLIQNIKTAATHLQNSKLKNLDSIGSVLNDIKQELELSSNEEAMMLVAILDCQCSGRISDIGDLGSYFKCTPLDVMEFVPNLNDLIQKGFIMIENKDEIMASKKIYKLCPNVFYSIIEGQAVKPVPPANANLSPTEAIGLYSILSVTR